MSSFATEDNASLPVIRGITVRLGAVDRIRNRNAAPYEVFLDEKPLGRRMQSAWQRCITLRGTLDLSRLDIFIGRIEDRLVSQALLAPDAGFVVHATDGSLRNRRVSDCALDSISGLLGRALERIPTA